MRSNRTVDSDAELASVSWTLFPNGREWSMGRRIGPAKIKQHSLEFKLKAVQLSSQPGVRYGRFGTSRLCRSFISINAAEP